MNQKDCIEELFHRYETAGLIEGDPNKVLSLIADDIIGIGMGDQGFVSSKEQVEDIVLNTVKKDDTAVYTLSYDNVLINLVKDTAANLCATVKVRRRDKTTCAITHSAFNQSLSLVCRDGKWLITALHASPVALTAESIESYPMTFADNALSQLRKQMREQAMDLINKSISGGILGVYLMGKKHRLYMVNDNMLSYLGYTEEEFKERFSDDVTPIYEEKDLKYAVNKVRKARADGSDFELQVKIFRKDGKSLSMIALNRFTKDQEGREILLGVYTDVTHRVELYDRLEEQAAKLEEQAEELSAQNEELLAQKQELERQADDLAISEERFRIALEKTSNIIFDCDIISGNIMHSSAPKESLDFVTSIDNIQENLILGGTVAEEFMPVLKNAFTLIKEGSRQAECVVKVKLATGREVWNKISMTGVQDSNGRNVRAIGLIEDITRQREAEIAELETKLRAERDSLTDVYNKGVCEQKIKESLGRMEAVRTGVFIMLDVDCFKRINDTYGHPFGDDILRKTAAILKNHFRASDIVGRIGGDEFCAFCCGIISREQVRLIAQSILEQVEGLFTAEDGAPGVSCSIGIARCAGIDKTFSQLYQEADSALYHTKNTGRNSYTFYDDIREV